MMNYIKRRFSSDDRQNEYTDTIIIKSTSQGHDTDRQSSLNINPIRNIVHDSEQIPKEKSKLLFIIDDQYTDW
jgi:hypothetical protein